MIHAASLKREDLEDYCVAREHGFQWMWSDAKLLPLPGMDKLAKMNPFRWDTSLPLDLADLFEDGEESRPVTLRIPGSDDQRVFQFRYPSAAAQWIRACEKVFRKEQVLKDYCAALEQGFQWMWSDAKLLPLPGMGMLARMNPFRWEMSLPLDLAEAFENTEEDRPVSVRVAGGDEEQCRYDFQSPSAAAEWIRSCQQVVEDQDAKYFTDAAKRGLECKWASRTGSSWSTGLPSSGLGPGVLVHGLQEQLKSSAATKMEGSSGPVLLRIAGSEEARRFESPAGAAEWIRRCSDCDGAMRQRAASASVAESIRYPAYWTNQGARQIILGVENFGSFKDTILMPAESLCVFQQMLDSTYTPVSTRDRPCPARPPCSKSGRQPGGCPCSRPMGNPGLPVRYRVCQALRVEDSAMWTDYCRRRLAIQSLRGHQDKWDCEPPLTSSAVKDAEATVFAPLDPNSNEMYLFHGTKTRLALKIASEDVRLNLAHAGGGLGPGLYLSESVTKSDEYASDCAHTGVSLPGASETPDPYYEGIFAMLVMRVAMGKAAKTDSFFTEPEKADMVAAISDKRYDSVLADRRKATGTFREFCVFDKDQVYTEYVIFYERVYGDPALGVPRMQALSCSSVAREEGFQFQVPSYWVNFHKNPNIESFDEEHPMRPRGVDLLQHTLRLFSGSPNLMLVQVTRLEHSTTLCQYVNFKLQVLAKGVSKPGTALRAVLSEDQYRAFTAAASQKAFSMENIDGDVNEVYLWAACSPMMPTGQLPPIRAAAGAVR